MLCSNCLIPKASLSLPPASYLRYSLAAPLLLIINLSLQGQCFEKHPPAVSGHCSGATWGIRKQSPQSRSARWNMTAFAKTAHGRCTYQITFSGCCTKALRSYLLSHTEGKGKKNHLNYIWLQCRLHAVLDVTCNKDVSERRNDAFLYSSR